MNTRRDIIAGQYHVLHVHDCPIELILQAAEASSGLAVVENLCPIRTTDWAALTVQLSQTIPADEVTVRAYSLDVQLDLRSFLRYSNVWDQNGVYAVFVSRPIPFRATDLDDLERYRALDNFDWSLELAIPGPSGPVWGTITSPRSTIIDALEQQC